MRKCFGKIRFSWIGLLILVIVFLVHFMSWLYINRGIVYDSLKEKELTLVHSERETLTSFFDVLGNTLTTLTRSASVRSGSEGSMKLLKSFSEQWDGTMIISDVLVTDRSGVVRYNSNSRDMVGYSFANDDSFVWAQNQKDSGEYYVSEPMLDQFGVNEGNMVVLVTSPIFYDDSFVGVATVIVDLYSLIDQYLGVLSFDDERHVYLINVESGEMVCTCMDSYTGLDLDIREMLLNSSSLDDSGTLSSNGYLVSYSFFEVGSNEWLLVATNPENLILGVAKDVFIQNVSRFILSLFTLIALVIGIVKINVRRK